VAWRGNNVYLTEEERATAKLRFETEGVTGAALAKEFGVSGAAISKMAKRHGWVRFDCPNPGPRKSKPIYKQARVSLDPVKLSGDTILTAAEIIAQRLPIPGICGVYFLIDNGSIVYVGQSTNVLIRVNDHAREAVKKFDSFSYIKCEEHLLDRFESLYIHVFRPVNNVSVTGRIVAPMNVNKLLGASNGDN